MQGPLAPSATAPAIANCALCCLFRAFSKPKEGLTTV